MRWNISYSCLTHIGKIRSMNQDNYICDGKYLDADSGGSAAPLSGSLPCDPPFMIGVFDGMGGEQCGEVASLIASECAANYTVGEKPLEDLLKFCMTANDRICAYAEENGVSVMGTTAALLAFTAREIALCNIGDSKVFRFADEKLAQLSVDHYAFPEYGRKPPLSQNLGIPAEEMVIEPYIEALTYRDGDVYLLCSDGLTDMVPTEEICRILTHEPFEAAAGKLLEAALNGGGKDNITIILCRVGRTKSGLFRRLFRPKNKKGVNDNGK